MKHLLLHWLLPLLLLNLTSAAWAATPPGTGPAAATPSLASALNPDGTLKAGATGSFDARAFRMRTAPDGRPVFRPAGTKGAGDERWADGFGLPNGTSGVVFAVVRSGADLYIGGNFEVVGNVVAKNVAKWNGTAWSALGTGLSNGANSSSVGALAVAGNGDVYAGGFFRQAGGVVVNSVAKWNGTAWSALGTGIIGAGVSALAVAGNGDVYVGGSFLQAGGVAANRIAKWNGSTWSALGTGIGSGFGEVRALAVAGNGDVYAGGAFTSAGGVAANRMAKWNGSAWSPLGTGIGSGGNEVNNALAVAGNGDVYAGGFFTTAGGAAANGVAKWNGSTWSAVGTGTGNGANDRVSVLAVVGNGDVYAGGFFTSVGGVVANNVAKWNGSTWSPLGTGIGMGGIGSNVNALAVAGNGDVYAGGAFTSAGGVAANNVARWNGSAWSALGTGVGGFSVGVLAVAGNGDVYAGGNFTQAGGVTANRMAKWNGSAWSALGTGVGNGYVGALAVASNGDVYAGGGFTSIGGVVANNVAKWNGSTWSPLGTGVIGAGVSALVVAGNGDLYAGGAFTLAGGAAANNVAKWNGSAWSAVGTGVGNGANERVYALAVAGNGDVYVGGFFVNAGGVAANNIVKWNGTAWSSLGTGTNYEVRGIVIGLADKTYVGGSFTTTGDGSKLMSYFGIYDPNAPLASTAATRAAPAALFPNPAHGAATLRLPATAPRLPLTLADALGRVVRRYPAPAGPDAVLDLRGLPAGTYVVRCGLLSQRLVVE